MKNTVLEWILLRLPSQSLRNESGFILSLLTMKTQSLTTSRQPSVQRKNLRLHTIPIREDLSLHSLPSSITRSNSNSSTLAKVYYNLTPISSLSTDLRNLNFSYESVQLPETPKTHREVEFTDPIIQSDCSSTTGSLRLAHHMSSQESQDDTNSIYTPRTEKIAGIVKEREKQLAKWKHKYYNIKTEALKQARLIEQLNDTLSDLKQQLDQKDKVAVKGLEKVLVNKNAEIRKLESELEAKNRELKALNSLKVVKQTSKEIRKFKSAVSKSGTLTYSHSDVIEIIRENEALKEKLKKASSELSQDVLTQLDSQFSELEEMQAKLLAENEALKKDKSNGLHKFKQETDHRVIELVNGLTKLKSEMHQINTIAKTLTSGSEISLDLLMGRHLENPPKSSASLWERSESLMSDVKQEVSKLRQTLSDSFATHFSSKGCQTQ